MKKIFFLIFLLFFISSCWKQDEVVNEQKEIKDFEISVKNISDFDNTAFLEKTWKVSSSQDITISSNVSWRVSQVYVREWSSVYAGQTIAILEDNLANYWFALESAKNSLEKSKLNYESTKVSLDKSIADIERNLSNLNVSDEFSNSSLELEKIENSITRLNIDYDKLVTSNIQTKYWFENNIEKEFIVLDSFMDDVIDFWDILLSVTPENQNSNSNFDTFLWAKDRSQKKESEEKLINLISFRDNNLRNYNVSFDENSIYGNSFSILNQWYNKIDDLLFNLDLLLDNSISSVWSLSDSQISSYKSQISWFQNTFNSYNSSYIAQKNNIESFIETYKSTENSLLKQISSLESDKKIYVKSLDINKESTNATLSEAKTNREISLKNLELIIKDAEISYSQAQKNYNKLFITSPISWFVKEVNVDKWQEIQNWLQLFSIYSEKELEVNISFTQKELEYISLGSSVFYYDSKWEKHIWSIYSISKNADENLMYLSKVSMQSNISNVWNIINLQVPITLENKLLPLDIVKVNSWNTAILNYLNGSWSIDLLTIDIWDVYSDKIELKTNLSESTKIITSFVWNYEKGKYNLKINDSINE